MIKLIPSEGITIKRILFYLIILFFPVVLQGTVLFQDNFDSISGTWSPTQGTPAYGEYSFKVTIDGGAVKTVAPVSVTGGVALSYDITALSNGNHTSTLQPCKGTRCGPTTSLPFPLYAPAAITGAGIK